MTLKIGFARATGNFVPLPRTIEFVERTVYSHSYFRFDQTGVDTIFQCNLKGTASALASDFLKSYVIIEEYAFELSDDDFKAFQVFCGKYTGTSYGLWQLFGILLAKEAGLKSNPFSGLSKNSAVCSELTYRLCLSLPNAFPGIDTTLDPKVVGLKKIHDIVSANSKALRIA